MAEVKRRRPQKAFTRKDFRYKREWRYAKVNEQGEPKKDKKKAAADGIIFFYMIFVIMNVVREKENGLKSMVELGSIGFIGTALMFIGMELALKPERKNKRIGDILVITAFTLIFARAIVFR